LAEECGRLAAVDGREENKDGKEGKVVIWSILIQ